MNTQPLFSNSGSQAPDRSRRRVADRPAACPELLEWACPEAHPVASTASRNPPGRRCPVPVLDAAVRAVQRHADFDAPRPQEFFGKNSSAHARRRFAPALAVRIRRPPPVGRAGLPGRGPAATRSPHVRSCPARPCTPPRRLRGAPPPPPSPARSPSMPCRAPSAAPGTSLGRMSKSPTAPTNFEPIRGPRALKSFLEKTLTRAKHPRHGPKSAFARRSKKTPNLAPRGPRVPHRPPAD